MNSKLKIKEWLGIASGLCVMGFALLGIFSLHSYITIWGSFAIVIALIISFKYV